MSHSLFLYLSIFYTFTFLSLFFRTLFSSVFVARSYSFELALTLLVSVILQTSIEKLHPIFFVAYCLVFDTEMIIWVTQKHYWLQNVTSSLVPVDFSNDGI